MKNFFSFLFVAIVVATLSFSCQTKTVDTKTVVKTTVKEIGTEGFLIKKVVKGDTVWGYSQEVYGTGVDWREIVKENPFLSQPNRVYYDKERAMWIVIIYPGESIRIRGQVVTPTFTSEETTVTTTTENVGIPWWGWLVILIGGIIFIFFLLGIVGLISYHRNCYWFRPCPAPCPTPCPPVPDPAMPSVNYTISEKGDERIYIEGATETIITRSATREVSITARK